MLTAKQEKFCQNLEIKKMSQRQAYLDAYPAAENWLTGTVDSRASELAKNSKVLERCEELRKELLANLKKEAKWTRDRAYKTLIKLIEDAQNEQELKKELTSPIVSAIINATKELNTIYAICEDAEGKGIFEDILTALRGINSD